MLCSYDIFCADRFLSLFFCRFENISYLCNRFWNFNGLRLACEGFKSDMMANADMAQLVEQRIRNA